MNNRLNDANVGFNISLDAFFQFAEYLDDHESDIAAGINDFAALSGVYEAIFDRKPSV